MTISPIEVTSEMETRSVDQHFNGTITLESLNSERQRDLRKRANSDHFLAQKAFKSADKNNARS